MLIIDFADLSLGMVMLHLFTFDPAWVKAKPGGVERLFYDGTCALCHGAVRFMLAGGPGGRAFRFAPLDSDVFRARFPSRAESLPDSMVVLTADGRLLTRSAGVLHILERLGGCGGVAARSWGVPFPGPSRRRLRPRGALCVTGCSAGRTTPAR